MLHKYSNALSSFKYVFSTVYASTYCILHVSELFHAETSIDKLFVVLRQIDLAKHVAHSLGTLKIVCIGKELLQCTV